MVLFDLCCWSHLVGKTLAIVVVVVNYTSPHNFSASYYSNIIWWYNFFISVNVDWISWDWRAHQAKAPIYVFLRAGLWFWFCLSTFLFLCVLMSCFSISVFLTFHIFLWTQRVQPFDKRYQYLLFAAEPYEIISFKVNHCFCLFFGLNKSFWTFSTYVSSCGNLLLVLINLHFSGT